MNQKLIHGAFVRQETRGLSFTDQDGIDAAKLPNLEPISPEILEKTINIARTNIRVILQVVLVFAVVLVISIVAKGYTYALAVGITIVVMLIGAFMQHLRAQIDETAVMMRIPVHHTEEKPRGSAAVCYLPDGKYLFRCDSNQPMPDTVYYIEFGKFTYCQLEKTPQQPDSPETAAETEASAEMTETKDEA